MEKDFNFTFPGKDGSSTSNVPQAFFQKQQSSSSRSLDSFYNDTMATGYQGYARNAVADSKKTKAVIASRRNDFFSDLMMPESNICVSATSVPVMSGIIPTAIVSNCSMRANDSLTVSSIPIASLNIPSTAVSILSTVTDAPVASSNVNIPSTTITIPLTTAVNQPSMSVNVASSNVNVSSSRVNIPSTTVNVSSTTEKVPSTRMNIPSTAVNNSLYSTNVPSTTVNVPFAAMNVPSITVNFPSTTVTGNVSSGNATVPSLTSMNIPAVNPRVSFSSSREPIPSTSSSAPSLHVGSCRTVPASNISKTAASSIPCSSASSEVCQVPDFSARPGDAIPCTLSSKFGVKNIATGLHLETLKLGSEQSVTVQTNYSIVYGRDSKIGFERPDTCDTDDNALSLGSSNLNSGKPDGVKTSIRVPHITGLNQGQQACPPVECIRALVQVVEPVCYDATPLRSIHLEPSPERIWGPQVSFLTFSCLDISRTEVVGQMRQVSSTGCLEVLGSGHRQDDSSEATKLIPSNGEFGSSSHSVSDSEKSTKAGRSPNDDIKSVSNSFQDFDWNRMTVDSSFRCKKTSTASGWFHSPSIRRKREPTTERDAIPVTKVKETWKGRMARTFRRVGSASTLSSADRPVITVRAKGTFDVPIELCVPSTEIEGLPQIVEICTRVIEERGIENQGIYRVPGNNGFVRQMVEDLNEDASGLCAGNERWHDVNVVSSLLKLFFRRLPDPLITYKLYQPVIDASRILDIDARLLRLRDVLHDLPPVNFRTFQFLAKHLHRVAEHGQVNKMDAHNLAIIFGPTLIRPRDGNMVAVINDMNDQCRIVESVILHHDWFFGISEEELEVPRSEGSKESTPVSSMSEELLAKAQQLGEFESPSCGAIDRIAAIEGVHKEKFRWGRDPKHSNDSGMALADTPTIVTDQSHSSIHEIVFEIKRYPAYHFKDSSMFCTENAKPKVRRTHSNESLGQRTTGSPAFGSRQNRSTVKGSPTQFNASCGQLTE